MSIIALYITHFTLGLISSFLGALPFGTVNLSVVDTTIRKSFKAGFYLSIAASLVEIAMSFIAVTCSMFIAEKIESSIYTKVFVFLLFVGLGALFFFRRQPLKDDEKPRRDIPDFIKGLILAIINPQVLPFWVFVITWMQSANLVNLDIHSQLHLVLMFLGGIWLGKLLALMLFGYLSLIIVRRISALTKWMNKIIGGILFAIAGWQGVLLVTAIL